MRNLRLFFVWFSPKRFGNLAVVYLNFFRARLWGRSYQPPMPLAVSIEPTTACNLRCPECLSGLRDFTRPQGNLSPDLFRSLINEISHNTGYLTFYFQGEPLLNRDFSDMVSYAVRKNMVVSTSTNGHFLEQEQCAALIKSGLHRLIISVDGISSETYLKYRVGGDFGKVVKGIENIVLEKRNRKAYFPEIIVQFVVFSHNESEVRKARDFFKILGVDKVVLKSAQVNNNPEMIPENPDFRRFASEPSDGNFNKDAVSCFRMWSSSVITWDGKVVPCCFDKDADFPMGKIPEQSFKEIWNSEPYLAFRDMLLTAGDKPEMCRQCSEQGKVFLEA
jgi:radical SAM protein with 4Fe4S-binding SPASM domain